MGRGKVELKKIENLTNRQVTFSKRRMGLLKKANELAILCDAQIGVIIFSGTGKMYEYSSAPWRITNIFDRYLKAPSTRFEEMDVQQKIIHEMTRMKDESNRLRIIMKQYMGDDLASLTLQDVSNLEQQIEFSLYKVRLRKQQQLLDQQLLDIRNREMQIPGDQSNYLCHMNLASDQTQAAAMVNPKPFPWWDVGSQMYNQDAESSMTALQLSPQLHEYKLQPLQPNLQEANLHGYVLRL
ncbi:MADS-box transcription factor 31-like isoform X1 [Oryza brachyantha]|uniref:MADS-box transcription factor 31-like isoform X1 n=1 Tax=Oryza brachyantha TaxID=4533 RepID=UPI0007761AF8|nr:MADS-box transcription factor 31-like isoform X1 [Oryza brachyantha]XP_015691698.1 MADS-box transcription factor 31-like isoform X1 [Oryza brachyantha]